MGVIFVQEGQGLDDLKDVYELVRNLRIDGSVARKLLRAAQSQHNGGSRLALIW